MRCCVKIKLVILNKGAKVKLKQIGEILMDNGKYKEVPCERYEHKVGNYILKLLVHASDQPWSIGVLDISEYYTGYRLTSTNKAVSSSSMKDVRLAVEEFVNQHGIDKIKDKIDWFLANSDRDVEEWQKI